MADLSGRQLGAYRLQSKIGQGGMGAVYSAVHQTLQVSRAIKVLLPTEVDEAVVERFVREGIISASLRHPNIVEIFDVGEQDNIHFLVMEFVEGESLLHLLRRGGAMPLDRAIKLLRQIADALDYAHARGIVHRDVKPSNIIVEPNDGVTLIDFGIARAMDESRLTRVGVVVGTFEYMAPEVVTEGGGTPGADRYALGIVAYQMLTGHAPFTGESAHSIMYKQVHDPPPPPTRFCPTMPASVEAALLRQLAKDPDSRFPSAMAFVDALAAPARRAPLALEGASTNLATPTHPGIDRPTPGSGQTHIPGAARVTQPAPAATMTPPPAAPQPSAHRPQPTSQTAIPAAPLTASRTAGEPFTMAGGPGTVLGTPQPSPKRSSAGLIVGILAVLVVLGLAAAFFLSPLGATVTDLVAGAPATSTVAAPAKPAVPPVTPAPATSVPAAASQPQAAAPVPPPATVPAPASAPTAASQPKPAATIVPTAPPAPTTPPTAAVPPTPAPADRLAQARQASAAGNHASALALLDDVRKANPAQPGLDDAEYDVHMGFGRSLLDAGNFDGSYEQFGAALKLRPNDGAAQAGRNEVILTKNYAAMEAAWDSDQERAIALLEENIQIDPGFRDTRAKLYALLIMKADRLTEAGERDAAYPVLLRASQILPEGGEAQRRLVSYTPTATPRPAVAPAQSAPQQAAPQQQRPTNTGGGASAPPPSSGSGAGSSTNSGGRSCPGGVCP